MDRRALFFLIAAIACFALTPVALAEHRTIAAGVGAVYLVLSALAALEAWSRSRQR